MSVRYMSNITLPLGTSFEEDLNDEVAQLMAPRPCFYEAGFGLRRPDGNVRWTDPTASDAGPRQDRDELLSLVRESS